MERAQLPGRQKCLQKPERRSSRLSTAGNEVGSVDIVRLPSQRPSLLASFASRIKGHPGRVSASRESPPPTSLCPSLPRRRFVGKTGGNTRWSSLISFPFGQWVATEVIICGSIPSMTRVTPGFSDGATVAPQQFMEFEVDLRQHSPWPCVGTREGQPSKYNIAFCRWLFQCRGMARPILIEFPGAIHHVTSRMIGSWVGSRERLFRDDRDYQRLHRLEVLRQEAAGKGD